jgi:glycosyltransferase involved in cell wall biosynthesis
MKLICALDSFGSGGAQRQLTTLAVGLKRLGHSVTFITYHRDDFFLPVLERAGIGNISLANKTRLQRPLAFRKVLQAEQPDAVLAFLEGPSLYCELAGLPSRRWGLIVSERLQVNPRRSLSNAHRFFHYLADYITTNSHANSSILARLMPGLASRLVTIYNCLDLETFRPAPSKPAAGALRFVVAASYQPRKNPMGLVQAVRLALNAEPALRLQIDWYGSFPTGPNAAGNRRHLEEVQRMSREFGIEDLLHFHDKEPEIVRRYQEADALLLPSLIEGLPNTVCEGMACGLPVLASRIGDAEVIVREGMNGFLFNPESPRDMARAFLQFHRLGADARGQMGITSRGIAEKLFAPGAIVSAYENLLASAAKGERARLSDWPPAPGRASNRPNQTVTA